MFSLPSLFFLALHFWPKMYQPLSQIMLLSLFGIYLSSGNQNTTDIFNCHAHFDWLINWQITPPPKGKKKFFFYKKEIEGKKFFSFLLSRLFFSSFFFSFSYCNCACLEKKIFCCCCCSSIKEPFFSLFVELGGSYVS